MTKRFEPLFFDGEPFVIMSRGAAESGDEVWIKAYSPKGETLVERTQDNIEALIRLRQGEQATNNR